MKLLFIYLGLFAATLAAWIHAQQCYRLDMSEHQLNDIIADTGVSQYLPRILDKNSDAEALVEQANRYSNPKMGR